MQAAGEQERKDCTLAAVHGELLENGFGGRTVSSIASALGVERVDVTSALYSLLESNLVTVEGESPKFWYLVAYRIVDTADPVVTAAGSDDNHRDSHRIVRHRPSAADIRTEIVYHLETGSGFEHSTGDVLRLVKASLDRRTAYRDVKTGLISLANEGKVGSVREFQQRGYRWFLADGLNPSYETLRSTITSLVSERPVDSNILVCAVRINLQRRVHYNAVIQCLVTLAQEGVLRSELPENAQCYRWFLSQRRS